MAPNNRLPRDFVPAATQLSLSAFRFLENGTQIVASDQLDQEDCCPLCLESCTDIIDADAGPILRTNTCNHIICSPCLSKYVHSARRYCDSCPLCRAKLFERDMRLVDDLHVDQNFGNQPSHQQQLREELRVWARIQRDEARRQREADRRQRRDNANRTLVPQRQGTNQAAAAETLITEQVFDSIHNAGRRPEATGRQRQEEAEARMRFWGLHPL